MKTEWQARLQSAALGLEVGLRLGPTIELQYLQTEIRLRCDVEGLRFDNSEVDQSILRENYPSFLCSAESPAIVVMSTGEILSGVKLEPKQRAELVEWSLSYFECARNSCLAIYSEGLTTLIEANFIPRPLLEILAAEDWEVFLLNMFSELMLRESQDYKTPVLGGVGDIAALSREQQRFYPEAYFYKPVHLEVEITHRCTLACPQCSIIEDVRQAKSGLENDQIVSFLNSAAKRGVFSYSITGGEPFIRFDDICKIISLTPKLDCQKIQTNGTYFSSVEKSNDLLSRLSDSGFGRNNKFIKSVLKFSTGIQDYAGEFWKSNLRNLLDAFEVINPEGVDFGICCTIEDSQPYSKLYQIHRQLRVSSAQEQLLRKIKFSLFSVNYNAETFLTHMQREVLPLESVLKTVSSGWHCVKSDDAVTPWPKMLLRADGGVYSCSCFGHVFYLGSILEASFDELLDRANNNLIFKKVATEGIIALLEYAQIENPRLGEKLIPASATRCQICKIIKTSIDANKFKNRLGGLDDRN